MTDKQPEGVELPTSMRGAVDFDEADIAVRFAGAQSGAEAAIRAALAEMDRSMYGDPEVPFRMRALLEEGL